MNKILIFFILIYLISCSSTDDSGKETLVIDCPRVFFSSENNIYLDSNNKDKDLDFEKLNYKASLNNYGFVGNCNSDLYNNNYNLDLLILTEPFNPKTPFVNMPIFVLLYDFDNNLIDKQYFRINGNLNFNEETLDYKTTEIIGNLDIVFEAKKNVGSLTIGFVNIN